MIEIILILSPFLLIILSFLLVSGIKKTQEENAKINNHLINISVVIPFKNEANRIKPLLVKLQDLDYPRENFEIIFVDDQSEDNTSEIINQFAGRNFKILSLGQKEIPGKKGALEYGIKKAKFDIIAITDADCEPEKDWLKSISKKISLGYDIVFGFSPLRKKEKFISKISSFENLRNYILYFASVGLGVPYSATSRNFAFNKQAYYKINGYRNTLETLSGDDDLFIREAVKQKLKIGVFRISNDLVYSNPAESFRDYFQRKSRHLKTSHHYLFKHKVFLGIWHSINIISLYSILLTPVSGLFVFPFAIKMLSDIITIQKVKNILSHNFKWFEIIVFQIFYETFLIINFINSLITRDKWK